MQTDSDGIQTQESPDVIETETKEGSDKKGRGEIRPFPRKTLSDALKVVTAIKEQNAGKPFPPAQIADAVGRKPRSSDFQVILAAAQSYGLVEGGVKSQVVSLTPLGQQIAYPKNQADEIQRQFEAFMKIDSFRQVFNHYENNKTPEENYFKNTLQNTFKINAEFLDEFIRLFEGNCRSLGIDINSRVSLSPSSIDVDPAATIPVQTTVVRSGRNRAFVIMPFVERNNARAQGFFKEVYRSLIEPAALAAGFEVEWANRPGSDIIQSTIINEVLDADLLIADLTDHNPNVLFELGLRLADNKGPSVLIKSRDTGRLFDVDNLVRVYEYSPELWKSTLEVDIPNLEVHIRATWDNRSSSETYLNILRRKS